MKTRKCHACGEEFETRNPDETIFCSRDCAMNDEACVATYWYSEQSNIMYAANYSEFNSEVYDDEAADAPLEFSTEEKAREYFLKTVEAHYGAPFWS